MANLFKYYKRGRLPKGFWGKRVLKEMNSEQHAHLPEWTFDKFSIGDKFHVLDMGCGGGANIRRMLALNETAVVTGLDYSQLSLQKTIEENYHAYVDKRCYVMGGNVMQMPFAKEVFDVVTAYETVYYWMSLDNGIIEAIRVLKPGGTLVIANELDGLRDEDEHLSKSVGGMRIYTADEINQAMTDTGLIDVHSWHDEDTRCICVTGRKPDQAPQR